MTPRAMMWVQTRLGLGHLARSLSICGALAADGFEVVLAHGGPPVRGLAIPTGVRIVQLPVAVAPNLETSEIFDANGLPVDDAWRARRIEALKHAIDSFRPDIVLTESFPFGRWLFAFELDPVLAWLQGQPYRPLIVASVRDILTRPSKPKKIDAMLSVFHTRYDLALCHADETIFRVSGPFPELAQIEDRVRYTGYVVDAVPENATERSGIIVVAGGGAAGGKLLQTAIDARRIWTRETGMWTLVAGPKVDAATLAALRSAAPPSVTIEGAVEGLSRHYARTALVVGQAGYNTVCEALRQGARLTVAPYAAGKETEQTMRAERFSELGLLTYLEEARLTPTALVHAMQRALDALPPKIAPRFDGAAQSARILRMALAERRS